MLTQHILCARVCSQAGGSAVSTGSGTRQTRMGCQLCLGPSVTLGMFLLWASIFSVTKYSPKKDSENYRCWHVHSGGAQGGSTKCRCLSSTSLRAWATAHSRYQLFPWHSVWPPLGRLSPPTPMCAGVSEDSLFIWGNRDESWEADVCSLLGLTLTWHLLQDKKCDHNTEHLVSWLWSPSF